MMMKNSPPLNGKSLGYIRYILGFLLFLFSHIYYGQEEGIFISDDAYIYGEFSQKEEIQQEEIPTLTTEEEVKPTYKKPTEKEVIPQRYITKKKTSKAVAPKATTQRSIRISIPSSTDIFVAEHSSETKAISSKTQYKVGILAQTTSIQKTKFYTETLAYFYIGEYLYSWHSRLKNKSPPMLEFS